MKLLDFVDALNRLCIEGHGDKQVYYRHGASGDCGKLSYASVTDEVDQCGPYDLEDGEVYISIYAGN